MNLKKTAKKVWALATKMKTNGEIPLVLGIDGMLALMYDSITRSRKDRRELRKLAVWALVLVDMEDDREEPIERVEIHQGSPIVVEDPPEESIPLPPRKFDNWQSSPRKAEGLREWMEDNGIWDRVTEEQRLGILEVIAGDTDSLPGGNEDDYEEAEEDED